MPPEAQSIMLGVKCKSNICVKHVPNAKTAKCVYYKNHIDVVLVSATVYDTVSSLAHLLLETAVIVVGESQDPTITQEYILGGASDYLILHEGLNSQHVALAIHKAYAVDVRNQARLESLNKQNEHLQQLNQASQLLASTLNSQEVLTKMLMEVTAITGAKDASVWEWEDKERKHLVCHASSNLPLLDRLRKHRVARGAGIAGWVVESGESTIVVNTKTDERFLASVDEWTGFQTESVLAVPLRVRDDVLGVLEILNKDEPFEEEDVLLAETLAASAAIALDNARLVETMREQQIELHARNTELDAFAHTVAHDLKTPLNWVQGYSELLIKDWELLKDADRIEYAKAARNGAHTMENIIDDLLLLASLRQSEVLLEPVDMHSVLRRARMRLQPMVEQYEAELVSQVEYPLVQGYSPWIEGVWVNYISNAIKYGGRPPHVELGCTDTQDGFIEFWVLDNGQGLTPEEQAKLFVPFARLNRATSTGHGLGLSIVQRIVEKLGGTVGIQSILGQGSCFSFRLPKYELNLEAESVSHIPQS